MATSIFNNIVFPYITLGLAELKAHVFPIIQEAFLSENASFQSALFLIVVLFLSWLVLFSAIRALYRIAVSIVQVAFYGAILAFLVWIYFRGFDSAYKDIATFVGSYDQQTSGWENALQDYTKAHFARSATTVLNHQTIVYPVYAAATSSGKPPIF
ncbi:uncharacterized protein SAPINGB_P003639 [Magnusiomyces paraingens]|uniref:Uncharacterized protein n=1 Tax=Magnusiomyces paraingens TaxID=2606893 RepID=A0A5E8BVS4_9ASCO|nr:uncharacterized protein SAPINGB_P003639 [Saprochaete ingens]VVT53567.1 unnamed protein product [Saprochaete ingens]